jgi:ABC-type branched-subunit amino acid transport system substrate-binding protein
LQPTVKIAVAVSLTGASNVFGVPALDGARLAVDEANVEGLGPHIDLEAFDDTSDPDKGRDIAEKVAASDANGSLYPSQIARWPRARD